MLKTILTLIMSAFLMHAFGQKTEWSFEPFVGVDWGKSAAASPTKRIESNRNLQQTYK